MTKLKKVNCDKTQLTTKLNLWQNSIYDNTLKESFSKNYLIPWQQMRCSLGSLLRFLQCFFFQIPYPLIFPVSMSISFTFMKILVQTHQHIFKQTNTQSQSKFILWSTLPNISWPFGELKPPFQRICSAQFFVAEKWS